MKKILKDRIKRGKFIDDCLHTEIVWNDNMEAYYCGTCGLQMDVNHRCETAWDCPCGVCGIWIGYCPDCGKRKPKRVFHNQDTHRRKKYGADGGR